MNRIWIITYERKNFSDEIGTTIVLSQYTAKKILLEEVLECEPCDDS